MIDERRRVATPRTYLMCPPAHFAVTYAINPWMRPGEPADAAVATWQWERLRQAYLDLGHQVRLIDPAAGEDDDGTRPEDPLAARAAELGRDAGKAAATWVFDGNTPDEAYRRVLRGIEDGDPAVLDAIEPPAIGLAAGYDQDDLARDLGLEPADPALPDAVPAYADAFTASFWTEVERTAREHAG